MKDWLLGDWCYGSASRAYERARLNEARARSADTREEESETRRALRILDGEQSFLLGTLADGTPVRLAPREVGRHAMVWGASGAGKSYGLEILTEGWTAAGRRLELIDPKGETFLLKALAAASHYERLPDEERERFAEGFRVFDVTPERLTPADLFALPAGMSPALLATLRAAAVAEQSSHAFSDLMAYGIFLLFSVVINLGWGLTVKIARALFLDDTFRARIASKVPDARLRDSLENLETTLPEQTRKAIVRQFDLLLAPAPARISFGLSPAMTRELLSRNSSSEIISLGNFGPTPLRPPGLAKTMATNRLIDVLTDATVRTAPLPQLLLLEEVGVVVKQPAVADYLLEASRTLRWKGLSIVCVAQDPSNAIPKETVTALVLNSKWLLAFECGKEEASWLLPHMSQAKGRSEAKEKRAFIAEMAKLPTQEAVFVRKGLAGFRLRLRDVPDPTQRHKRERLLEVFETKIAARSMVSLRAAEERIAAFEASLFDGAETPTASPRRVRSESRPSPASLDEFLSMLARSRDGTGGHQ